MGEGEDGPSHGWQHHKKRPQPQRQALLPSPCHCFTHQHYDPSRVVMGPILIVEYLQELQVTPEEPIPPLLWEG